MQVFKAYQGQCAWRRVVFVQAIQEVEGVDSVEEATAAVKTILGKVHDLETLVGPVRRAAIVGRLSNTGSSKEGAIYANRIDLYRNKVLACHTLKAACAFSSHS